MQMAASALGGIDEQIPGRASKRMPVAVISLTAAMIPLSFIRAPYPQQLILQHVPTVIAVAALLVLVRISSMSRYSFVCAIAFLWIHLLGARWIYSFVPYDDWVHSWCGCTLSEQFGWQRNHYDRFVHFASGILGVPIGSELLQRAAGVQPKDAAVLAVSLVLSVGAVYEILEWLIAVSLSPAHAEAYNGQQGDIWDPQKDLALAGFGAILSALVFCRWSVPK
jgi:putative membrane protein